MLSIIKKQWKNFLKMNKIKYKSKDNYFDIIEEKFKNYIKVTYIYNTTIYNIKNFKTYYYYNLSGDLIKYNNDILTQPLLYNPAVNVLKKPKLTYI